ncbi:MAG: methionine--tRNA ligase [Candidatus Saccharimonadales bacterium]
MAKFYVSTPIYYINAPAHIGNAYTTVAADVLARYYRQQNDEVFFSVGTDENSQKTVKAAEQQGLPVGEYADALAAQWKLVWDRLNISYDRFVRTTEQDHQTAVYAMFERLQASGDIYKDTYRGLYCEGCEGFVRPGDLKNGLCPDHQVAPQEIEEENYFFKLSRYQQALLDHITANPEFIQPESRRNEVVAFITRGLDDFSISREGKEWGIPYPGDPAHKIYVWVEALMNYLTVTGYPAAGYESIWPADVHLVGKDIIKFHCVYWPALLMSAELPLPRTVMANGFLNIGGTKISKSLGNAIDPLQLVETYGVDALRYILLRSTPFGQDGDFTMERFEAVYNSDLANDLGNLVSRVAAMITKYQEGTIGPAADPAHDTSPYHSAIKNFRFDLALEQVANFTKDLNLYIEEEKPWQVAREDPEHLQEILAYLASNLVRVGQMLQPFMPETGEKIATMFGGTQLIPIEGTLFPKSESHPTDTE